MKSKKIITVFLISFVLASIQTAYSLEAVTINGKRFVFVEHYNDCVDENNKCAELLEKCAKQSNECVKEIKNPKPPVKEYIFSGSLGFVLGLLLMLII